jgi:16S rRNA (cytosine1402-N4)-methyltransferase
MRDGPLDMRMDRSQELTAADIVNTYSEKDIADILYQYGEERRSRAIARSIVHLRPLVLTSHLGEFIRPREPFRRCESRSTTSLRVWKLSLIQRR